MYDFVVGDGRVSVVRDISLIVKFSLVICKVRWDLC